MPVGAGWSRGITGKDGGVCGSGESGWCGGLVEIAKTREEGDGISRCVLIVGHLCGIQFRVSIYVCVG